MASMGDKTMEIPKQKRTAAQRKRQFNAPRSRPLAAGRFVVESRSRQNRKSQGQQALSVASGQRSAVIGQWSATHSPVTWAGRPPSTTLPVLPCRIKPSGLVSKLNIEGCQSPPQTKPGKAHTRRRDLQPPTKLPAIRKARLHRTVHPFLPAFVSPPKQRQIPVYTSTARYGHERLDRIVAVVDHGRLNVRR